MCFIIFDYAYVGKRDININIGNFKGMNRVNDFLVQCYKVN